MKKYSLLLGLIISVLFTQAQSRNCGTMQHLDELIQNDPQIQIRMQQQENIIQQWINNQPEGFVSLVVITIPVVVHVIYKTSSQNISTAQVQSQIDILNEDFRKLNSDASLVPSAFSGVAADCEIEFCLAVRDPNGNITTGITRTYTTTSSFSGYTSMKYSSSGGHNAWNTSDYLNIWVCNLSSGLLGFATFPGGNASTDGVVCDYAYFGDIGTATYPYHLGRTATHEVGHYLNLWHIWGNSNCGNDYCNDTPTQQTSNYGCPTFPSTSSCSGNGNNGDMFMNYMDYTNDACMYMFSDDQKTRMQATLNGSRSSLQTSNGCVPVNVPIVLSASITDASCNGSADGSIDLSVSGGLAPFTYSWNNGASTQDISNLATGNYTVSVTDAQGQVETATYTIVEPTLISISYNVTNTSAPGMSDGAIYTSTTGGTPPYTYYWVSPYSTNQNLINIPAGTYIFYAIDDNNCFATSSILVENGTLTPISVSVNITHLNCNGDGNGSIDLNVSGGILPYNFLWNNGATTEDLTNLSGGNYTISITDASGQTFSSTYTVVEPAPINISYNITNASSVGANDGAIDLTVSGGTTPYLYYWNTSPTQNTQNISNLTAGTYTVWVVDANSCIATIAITVSENTTIICNSPIPTGLSVTDLTHDRAKVNWSDANTSLCLVEMYRVQYRELGTTAWSTKTALGSGLCNFGLTTTSKMLWNLTPSTTYEYRVKAWYCLSSASVWSSISTFTTEDVCPNVINFAVSTPTNTKAVFAWTAPSTLYSFVRIKLRVDTPSSTWFTAGGFGVMYPALTRNKNGLTPGQSYRASSRTWCNPSGGPYKALSWTSFIFWTQPGTLIRIEDESSTAITDLEVYPNPSRDIFNVTFTSEDIQTIEVRVISLLGEVIFTENKKEFVGQYTKQFDLATYPKGIYMLEIETNSGVVNKKLILQ